jgi:hypothetical protein
MQKRASKGKREGPTLGIGDQYSGPPRKDFSSETNVAKFEKQVHGAPFKYLQSKIGRPSEPLCIR